MLVLYTTEVHVVILIGKENNSRPDSSALTVHSSLPSIVKFCHWLSIIGNDHVAVIGDHSLVSQYRF